VFALIAVEISRVGGDNILELKIEGNKSALRYKRERLKVGFNG
jgi:hypothetical protein